MIKRPLRPGFMQEIPRAILLPPPSTQRSTRGTSPADRDLPVEVGARRSANSGASSFLALIETRREDSVEFTADSRGAKQFRFRPYTNRGATAERDSESNTIERPAAGELAGPADADGQAARAIFDGFESGDGSRNSSAFLASFIAQEQLSEGLYNPPYGGASDAYRRAGGSPPVFDDNPRVVSFAA
jgi:hypothetical protein